MVKFCKSSSINVLLAALFMDYYPPVQMLHILIFDVHYSRLYNDARSATATMKNSSKGLSKVGLFAVLVIVAVGLGFVFSLVPSSQTQSVQPQNPAPQKAPEPAVSSGSSDTLEIKVDNKDLLFVPASATVKPGQKVRIININSDPFPHTIITEAEKKAGKIGDMIDQGKSKAIEFAAPQSGEAKFYCGLHPGMLFTLKVEP